MTSHCNVCGKESDNPELFAITRNKTGTLSIGSNSITGTDVFYICKQADCLERVRESRLIEKYFQIKNAGSLCIRLAKQLTGDQNTRLSTLVGMALRSRQLLLGRTAVEQGARRRKVYLILIDQHVQKHTRVKIEQTAQKTGIPLHVWAHEEPLESIVQKTNCKVAGLLNQNIALEIREILKT